MVAFSSVLSAGLLVAAANAAPMQHQKRIAQVIADSTKKWVAACTAAGGAAKCQPVSQTAFTTLLAAGGNCDQQNAADQMVDLAKTLNNDPDMIKFAQLFAQQPRNAPDSLAVPYCQTAPKNQELNGFFHCQFAGVNQAKFSGDQSGNLPLGVQAVNPPGSCPAKTSPVDDGTQLTDVTSDPGTPQGGNGGAAGAGAGAANSTAGAAAGGANNAAAAPGDASGGSSAAGDTGATGTDAAAATGATGAADVTGTADATVAADATGAAGANNAVDATGTADATVAADATGAAGANNAAAATGASDAAGATDAAAPAATGAAAGGFKEQNGKDAQAQNAKFAGLSASSACTDGDQACVGGGFAQCVGGKFQVTQCSGGTKCFALPLVNKAGTSVTCSTEADAQARIAASGAQGGVTGA